MSENLEDVSDDELFEELQSMDGVGSTSVFNIINSDTVIKNKEVSNERLSKCIECEFYNGLRCSKDSSTILIKIRVENSKCPIGEW